jgi:hypothetical protein
MTDKMLLRFFTYGIPEYLLLFFFSCSILFKAVSEEFTYVAIINILLLLMIIPLSIWMFFNKTKGSAHFFATAMRMFLLSMTVNIMNLDSLMFEDSDMGPYWFSASMVITIICMVVFFKRENQRWDKSLEYLIKIRKINLENKKFRVLVPVIHESVMRPKRIKKGVLFVEIIIALIFLYLFWKQVELVLYRILAIILGGGLAEICAKFLCWTINLKKMEYKLNVKFLTEYADKAKLARMSRRKW